MKADSDLVKDALSDGPEAFGPIVRRYQGLVFGVALSRVPSFHDAEDISQIVFIEAFEHLESLKDPSRLAAWLRSITIHRCINHLQRGPEFQNIDGLGQLVDNGLSPEAQIEQKELREKVMAAIGRLSNAQRETVNLFYLSEYSQQEIASILAVPLGTIKRRLHDARKTLRTEMLAVVEDTLKTGAPGEDFGKRVFELLCLYGRPQPVWSSWPWAEFEEKLQEVGIDGVDGFRQAMEIPHAETRRFALRFISMMQRVAATSTDDRAEVLVELLKQALRDRNRKVRKGAMQQLLWKLETSESRVGNEFIPLVLPLLQDPSWKVRWRTAVDLRRWVAYVPLEVAARALAAEPHPRVRGPLSLLVQRILESGATPELPKA